MISDTDINAKRLILNKQKINAARKAAYYNLILSEKGIYSFLSSALGSSAAAVSDFSANSVLVSFAISGDLGVSVADSSLPFAFFFQILAPWMNGVLKLF